MELHGQLVELATDMFFVFVALIFIFFFRPIFMCLRIIVTIIASLVQNAIEWCTMYMNRGDEHGKRKRTGNFNRRRRR